MDNNRLKRILEFDLADAPMLMAAVRLAACTSMMCGHKDADQKLRQYQKILAALIPPEAASFEEETWAEIGMALMNASAVHITIVPRRWERDRGWWHEGQMKITVTTPAGVGVFHSDAGMGTYVKRGEDAAPQALAAALQHLAPMDCPITWDSAPK